MVQRDLWGKRKMSWRGAFSGSNARKTTQFPPFICSTFTCFMIIAPVSASKLSASYLQVLYAPLSTDSKKRVSKNRFFDFPHYFGSWQNQENLYLLVVYLQTSVTIPQPPLLSVNVEKDIVSVSVKSKSGSEATLWRTLIGSDKPYLHMSFSYSPSLSPSLWMCNEIGSWVMNTSKNMHFFYFLLLQSPVRLPVSVFFLCN